MSITIPVVSASGAKSTVSVTDPVVTTVAVPVNVGETTILAGADNGNGNLIVAQPITLVQAGSIQSLSFYVATVGGNLRLGLYSGATPTTKVAETAEFTPVAGWNTKPTLTQPNCAPGQYWLVYFPQSNSLAFRKTETTGTSYYKTLTYGTLPASFPAAPSTTPSHWSFYATFMQGPPPADTAAPSVPSSLSATATTATTAAVLWTASTDNVGVTGYNVFRNNVQIGTSTVASFNDTGLVDGTVYSYQVSSYDAAGNNSAKSSPLSYTHHYVPSTLPAGVTLKAIDGETMTSTMTMSNNYYGRNGFNTAWDSPNFFPIGVWRPSIQSQGEANLYKDLNINVALGLQNTAQSSWITIMQNSGIWFLPENDSYANTNPTIVGNAGYDEPLNVSQLTSWVTTTPNAYQSGRFWFQNFTWAVCDRRGNTNCVTLGPPPSTETILSTNTSTPSGAQRHPDMICQDSYWFNSAYTYPGAPVSWVPGALGDHLYLLSRDLTVGEMARGCRYGDTIDIMRLKCTTYSIPIANFIENGGPADPCPLNSFIKPSEMNAAVWSTLIHGCRFPIYFNVTFGPTGGAFTRWDNFADSYYQSPQNGQPISIYAQAKNTNTLIAQMATVLNSPIAVGFVAASPAAPQFSVGDGIDALCKYHNVAGGDNKFYIFAMPRHSASATNIAATFTIKNTGATQVTVINESRTIPITNGGTQFADTFATGNTVHIYRIG